MLTSLRVLLEHDEAEIASAVLLDRNALESVFGEQLLSFADDPFSTTVGTKDIPFFE